MSDWKEVTVILRYRESALTPGGVSRDEPETVEDLVEEIDRAMNATHFEGQIELSLVQPPGEPLPDLTGIIEDLEMRAEEGRPPRAVTITQLRELAKEAP